MRGPTLRRAKGRTMFSALFTSTTTAAKLREAAAAWRLVAAGLLGFGSIGTIIDQILMLKSMDDPAKIGPVIAMSLLTSLYGLVLAFVVAMPIQARLESRTEAAG